jgi:hypothetical protein
MIVTSYYFGMVVLAIALHAISFLAEEREKKFEPLPGLVLVSYIALGWYLFGWVMGLVNIVIFSAVGSLLDYPVEQLGKRLFPNAIYRGDFTPDVAARIRKFGIWLGINRPKS